MGQSSQYTDTDSDDSSAFQSHRKLHTSIEEIQCWTFLEYQDLQPNKPDTRVKTQYSCWNYLRFVKASSLYGSVLSGVDCLTDKKKQSSILFWALSMTAHLQHFQY